MAEYDTVVAGYSSCSVLIYFLFISSLRIKHPNNNMHKCLFLKLQRLHTDDTRCAAMSSFICCPNNTMKVGEDLEDIQGKYSMYFCRIIVQV